MKTQIPVVKDALSQLKALGDERVRARNKKHGAGDNQFGVPNGEIRKVAKRIKTDHELALAIGERLGVYRDYPVSKGCTSPFAPIWINEIVRRKGSD